MVQGVRGWRVTAMFAGAIAAGTQVVLVREVLSAFLGNELVIGIMLFDWLALTGLGALLMGRREVHLRPSLVPPLILGLFLGLPPLSFLMFRLLPSLAAPAGSMPEIWVFLVGSIVMVSPVSLASGAAFSLLTRISSSSGRPVSAGVIYAWEGLGSLIGGLLFGVLLFNVISSADLLLVLCAISGIVGCAMAFTVREWSVGSFLLGLVCLLAILRWTIDPDTVALKLRYPGYAVLSSAETPFGTLTATRLNGQTAIFTNNIPVIAEGDVQSDEEIVHLALAQRPTVKRVLIAGGNPAGLVPEALKYRRCSIYCLEENPWMCQFERNYLMPPGDARVHYLEGDLRRHLTTAEGMYDALLLVTPEPSSLQLNRFYTREMLNLTRKSLRDSGILCLSLPSSAEYAGNDARNVRAILQNTLHSVFRNVLAIPVGRDIFLASDSSLRGDVAAAIGQAGVSTTYANAYYIQDDLLQTRIEELGAALKRATPLNSDDRPALMLAQIKYWIRFFTAESWIPGALFAVLLLAAIRANRASLGVMTAGCGGIILELMILMIVQVEMGNVYKMIGAFIGVYMAGMSAGAYLMRKVAPTPGRLAGLQGCLAFSIICSALVQPEMSAHQSLGLAGLVACLCVGSFCAGGIFSITSRMDPQQPAMSASHLYAVDLMGSAVGALLVGPVLLPLLGVHIVADLAAGMIIAGTVITLTSPVWRVYAKA